MDIRRGVSSATIQSRPSTVLQDGSQGVLSVLLCPCVCLCFCATVLFVTDASTDIILIFTQRTTTPILFKI